MPGQKTPQKRYYKFEYEGIDLCRKEGVDFILALGGGSTIDSSKTIAAGTLYDRDFWDFYSKGIAVEKGMALPV